MNTTTTKRQSAPARRLRFWRIFGLIALTLVIIGGVGIALYLRPYPPNDLALVGMMSGNGVTVTDDADLISFTPDAGTTVGLVYYPGALVDPRAYADRLHRIAERGYAVYLVKMPLNLAVLGLNRADGVITDHPAITAWAIGGHSLGGAMACSYVKSDAAHKITALLFHAAYCDGSANIADRSDLLVGSLYATNDGLATPAKIAATRNLLPPSTRLIEIVGSVHAYFGDYGPQAGDGTPTVSRDAAAAQIVDESAAFLAELK